MYSQCVCLLLVLLWLTIANARAVLNTQDGQITDIRNGGSFVRINHRPVRLDDSEKYFREAPFSHHYDGRFASLPLAYDDRREHLTRLTHTYFRTMNDIGVETWLMHGSLLGWYWNRNVLPWDSDIDVMVSEKSIHHLANYYNMSMHHYPSPDSDAGRDYLLEINPHYTNSSTTDRANVIDARWICTQTGLFIDITTLRQNLTAQAEGIDGAMMVKDRHHYMYDYIFPLRETTFEGVDTRVPFAYADLLMEEYGPAALTKTTFEAHRFDTEKQEWRPLSCLDYSTCQGYRGHLDLPKSLQHEIAAQVASGHPAGQESNSDSVSGWRGDEPHAKVPISPPMVKPVVAVHEHANKAVRPLVPP